MRYEQAQATYRAMLDANSHIRRATGESLRLHYFSGFVYHAHPDWQKNAPVYRDQQQLSSSYVVDYTINGDQSRARHRLTHPHNSAYFVAMWERREQAKIDKLAVWHTAKPDHKGGEGAASEPANKEPRQHNTQPAKLIVGEISDDSGATWRPMTAEERALAERAYNAGRTGISHATADSPNIPQA